MVDYVVQYDVLSAIIIFVMMIAHYFSPFKNERLRRVYMELLVSVFLSCILDVASSELLMNPLSNNKTYDFICYAVTLLYNMINVFPSSLFIVYVYYCIKNTEISYKMLTVIYIPVIISEFFLAINPLNKLVFSIENGVYLRGPLMLVLYACIFIYVSLALVILFWFWSIIDKNVRLVIALFCVISFIIILIQYKFPNQLVECAGMTIVLLVVYFTIQNQDAVAETTARTEDEIRTINIANKAKNDLLANMSHEIRTPLTTILGLNELILNESESLVIKSYANDIQKSGKVLMSLVDGILNFSKIESGKMNVDNQEYSVEDLVRTVVEDVKERAYSKKLQLNIDVNAMIPKKLYGDYLKLYQVITNLLINAIKYSESGYVELRVNYERIDVKELFLKVTVKDTGIGIKSEYIDKLSARFNRLDNNENRWIEGTGLGLTIVTEILELFDSKLEVESKYGSGSEFSFSIQQKIADNSSLGTINWIKQTTILNESVENFTTKDALVLVVDDNERNLFVMRKFLNMNKIKVISVENGEEALLAAKKYKFDMVFIDYMMPKMDGEATLKALRKEGMVYFQTPVVVLTANVINGIKEKYISAGFDDYLAKPINRNDLEKILLKYLPKKKIFMNSDG